MMILPQGPQDPVKKPQDPVVASPAALPLATPAPTPVVEPERSILDDARDAAMAAHRERKQWEEGVRNSVMATTAAEAAKAWEASGKLGIRPDIALKEPITVDEAMRRRAIDQDALRQTHPGLARQMEDAWFAMVAQDDVENLKETEGIIGWIGEQASWVGRQFKSGFYDMQAQGYLGLLQATGSGSPEITARMDELRDSLSKNGQGWIGGGLQVLGQVFATAPPAIGVGAAASLVTTPIGGVIAGGATALSMNSLLETGRQYDNMRQRGIPHEQARGPALAAGIGVGTLDTLADLVGARVFGKAASKVFGKTASAVVDITKSRAKREFVLDYLKVMASNTGTEGLQGGWEWAAEQQALKNSGFSTDEWSSLKSRMVDSMTQAAQSMAIVGGLGPAANYLATASKAGYVNRRAEYLDRIGKAAKDNTFADKAPSLHEEFIGRTAGEAGVATAHVDGAAMAGVLRQMDADAKDKGEPSVSGSLEAKIPGITDKITQAVTDGEDVSLPMEKIVRAPIFDNLKEHIRLDPTEPSFAEVEAAQKEAAKIITATEKTIEEREVFDKAGDEIETRLVNEVVATGAPVSKEQAQAFATLARNVSDNLAQEQGKLPSELKPLTVGKETPGQGGGLNQFAGESAKGAPRSAFRKATEMLRSGSTKEQIFTETGISVGADGALRFEISDHDASIKGDVKAGPTTLGELLHHPRLFKAYPQLHSLKVFVDGDSSTGVEGKRVVGSYRKSQRMWIGDRKPLGSISLAIMSGPRMLSSLLHEIQHAIQDAEGFHGSLSASSDATTVDSHRKAPEEIEARNTQARQALTPDDRRRTPPEATEDIKSIAVVADSNILNQPSRGSYDIANNKITLNERTNASTLMHELAHAAWNMMLAIAEPSAALQANIDAMFKWFGITREQWDAMGVEKQEKYQERLAASFEKFLEEGKAPTVELQSVFERIAKWIRDAYKDIVGKINENHRALYGEDLPALTDEVRRVFGSMIAAEDAIANAEVVRGRMAAFQTREEFPGTDADWLEYQALVAARREGGISKLTASMQGHIRWLKRSKDELTKAENKDVLAARKAAEVEAKDEVEQRDVYRLRAWIKDGKKVLRLEDIEDVFGNESEDILKALDGKAGVGKEGWSIDYVAQEFGFDSGEAMVRALIDEPELADAIANRVDEIVMRDHGSLRTEHDQVAAIEAALNTEAASRLAYETLRLVQGVKTPDRKMRLVVKEMARLKLRALAVREVKPARFLMAATRAERAASEAFKGKKPSKAKDGSERPARDPSPMEGVRFLEQSLLNTEMAKQAAEAQKDIEKAKRLFAKFFGSDKDIGKHRNLDIVNAGRAILASFSLYGGSKLPLEFLAGLEKYSPELFARLNEKLVRATNGNTIQDYKDMPFGEFADLADTVKMLWQESQRTKQIEVDGKTTSRDAVVAEMIAVAVEVVGLGDTSSGPVPADARKKTWMADIVAHVRRVESWALKMDGNKPSGIWTRALFRPMRTRFDLYMSDRGRLVGKMETLLRGVNLSERLIDAEADLGHTFTDMNQLLGALLHIGSQSSLRKLLLGYGWGSETKMGDQMVLDTSRWDSFISKAIERGTLTKEHFDMIQAIWNINAELKPIAQKVNHEIAGVYFTEVEARPFTNKFGTFAGGYAPAPPDLAHKGNKHIAERVEGDILAEMERNFVESMPPAASKSFTIERNNSANPLVLDLRMQSKHFDQVLRFVHLQPAVRDALSLLQDEKLSTYLNQVDPSAIRQMLMPWLKDTAANQRVRRTRFTAMDGFFSFVRRAVGLRIMFGSISNALQQLTGISNVLAYVKAKHVGAAYWKVRELGGHVKALDYVKSQSVDMAVRLDSNLATSSDEIELLLNPSKWGRLQAMAGKHGYFMQRYMQNRVDVIAWIAAQSQSIAAGKSPEAAALEADSVVRLSQGSHAVVDVAAYERSSAFGRLFTQFSGYYNTVLNQIITAPEDQKTKVVAMALVMPAFAAASIAAALGLGSEFDDDDDTGLGGEIAWWMFKTPAKAVLSLVPGFGQLAAQRIAGEGSAGDRISLAPFASAIDSLSRTIQATFDTVQYALGNDEMEERVKNSKSGAVSGAGIRDFANAVSDVSGIPVALLGKAFGYLEDVADEKMPAPSGVLEAMSGITGNLRMPKR
jgi:hypothetical protein